MNICDMSNLLKDLEDFLYGRVDIPKDVPLSICRYNSEQVIDRVVIQIRGGYGVTIHTADAGQGGK